MRERERDREHEQPVRLRVQGRLGSPGLPLAACKQERDRHRDTERERERGGERERDITYTLHDGTFDFGSSIHCRSDALCFSTWKMGV